MNITETKKDGRGRPKKDKTAESFVNVRITKEARRALESVPRMQRGLLIDKLIKDHFMI